MLTNRYQFIAKFNSVVLANTKSACEKGKKSKKFSQLSFRCKHRVSDIFQMVIHIVSDCGHPIQIEHNYCSSPSFGDQDEHEDDVKERHQEGQHHDEEYLSDEESSSIMGKTKM